MRVYLAGPCVFLPDPVARGAAMKAICARHGLVGVFPLDDLPGEPAAWASLGEPFRIARRNEAHIASCDALVANLTPFRGASADVGTVFELGFMRALGRPVFGWSNDATPFAARTRALTLGRVLDWGATDRDGMMIEDFGLADNLMLEGAIDASGGAMVLGDCPAEARWTDLSAFEACLVRLRASVR